MRASHRLDVLIVPTDPAFRPIASAKALLGTLTDAEVIDISGAPGPESARWMPGGFARLSLDLPRAVTLYANRQGGFRVQCPMHHSDIAAAFNRGVTDWRAGGPRSMPCPACGTVHPLEALDARPPMAFAALALVTADAAMADPSPWALARTRECLGAVRVVRRRG